MCLPYFGPIWSPSIAVIESLPILPSHPIGIRSAQYINARPQQSKQLNSANPPITQSQFIQCQLSVGSQCYNQHEKKARPTCNITLKRRGLALSVLFVARDSHILLVNPHLLPRHPAEALPGTWGHSLWASFNYSEQWEYELRETESISSTYRLGRTSCWILCLMLHSWEASWRTDGCKLLSGSRGQGSEFRYAPVCSTWNE